MTTSVPENKPVPNDTLDTIEVSKNSVSAFDQHNRKNRVIRRVIILIPVSLILVGLVFIIILQHKDSLKSSKNLVLNSKSSTEQGLAPSDPTAPSSIKPPLSGLLDMGDQTPYQNDQPFPTTNPSLLNSYAGDFSGIVVNESWSQLEPRNGVYNWDPLNQSLNAVSSWNSQHASSPIGVKLRIFAGQSAPNWVLQASSTVVIDVHGASKTVGRWWTMPFMTAWHNFQNALAQKYDNNPLVRAVSVSSCSSSTGEPFVVSGALTTRRNLQDAGWTVEAQDNCLSNALNDYSGWKHTQITFAFSPLYSASSSQVSFMDQMMQKCANSQASGGPDCVLGNNDLSPDPLNTSSGPAYSEISQLVKTNPNTSVYFQTAGPNYTNLIQDCQAMQQATNYNATSVELWPGTTPNFGFHLIPNSTLANWNKALSTHSKITCQ